MTGASWRVGDEIEGLYRVTRVHLHGGMGLVYRVRHLGWDVDLAVKSPRPALFRHPVGREGFLAEARTWISLGLHPHLCSCFYVRAVDGIPRIFAEYAAGGSLRDLLDRGRLRAMEPERALGFRLDLAIQVAWGLEHAHRRGVVHQDVKPANILLDEDGTAKVTDFGLSRSRAILAAEEGAAAGRAGVSVAVTAGGYTPGYASPEQVAGRPLGRRTDVWSFAVTVLEMFVGAATWGEGPNAPVTLAEQRTAAAMPDRLARLLGRCLRHEPSQRPATMAEIAEELIDLHEHAVGPYPRTAPAEAALRADELNNHALSRLDLGEDTHAEQTLREALRIDPTHLEATFNSLTLRWRRGEISDEAAVATMSVARTGAPGRWEGAYLLGQLHLERGDLDAALPLLREAAAGAGDEPEVSAVLRQAEAGALGDGLEEHVLTRRGARTREERGTEWMTAASLSTDGRVAMTARVIRDPVPRNLRTYLFGYRRQPDRFPVHLFSLSSPDPLVVDSGEAVTALDLGDDGRLAAWGTGTAVRVREAGDGRHGRVVMESPAHVSALRFGPGCSLLAGAAVAPAREPNRILVWDVASGGTVLDLTGPSDRIRSLAFSADGSLLAAGADDGTVQVWHLRTGRHVGGLSSPDRLNAVGIGNGGRTAVTGGHEALRVWDLATGECRHVLGDAVEELWLHDTLVLTATRNGDMRLWDTTNGRCLRTFEGHRDERARLLFANETLHMPVRIDPDGRRAHSVSNNDTVRSWGLPRGHRAPLRVCRPRPHARVRQLDDRLRTLLAASESAAAEGDLSRTLSSLSEARTLPGYERDASVVVAWRRLLTGAERVGLRAVWQARSITLPGEATFWHRDVAVSGDGRHALSSTPGHTMVLWDLDTGRAARTYALAEHGGDDVSVLAMTVDASHAVVAHASRDVRLWDLRTGTPVRDLGEPFSTWMSVAVDRAGRTALVQNGDGVLRLWDLADGRRLRAFRGPTRIAHFTEGRSRRELEQVNAVSVSADGRVVMAALQYSGVVYWAGDRRRRRALEGYADRVDTVQVSADGRFAVTGGWDTTVRHWDLATGKCLRLMAGHTHPVLGVDLTADGRFAFSAGMDEAIRVWDVTTGRCVHVLEGQTALQRVRVSEDGTRAVSLGGDGTLRVWEIDWDLAVPEPVDWDERAQPYLDQHHDSESFDELLTRLRRAGLGRLRPEGVHQRLLRHRARRR
ncbi:protein kinase domain-containing protein [Streptomyces tendae]|uniref:protein kinase domain-containing protein n=1 Tax=Streptomyces tendae TaxID=1932 RepID=UPI00368C3E64